MNRTAVARSVDLHIARAARAGVSPGFACGFLPNQCIHAPTHFNRKLAREIVNRDDVVDGLGRSVSMLVAILVTSGVASEAAGELNRDPPPNTTRHKGVPGTFQAKSDVGIGQRAPPI